MNAHQSREKKIENIININHCAKQITLTCKRFKDVDKTQGTRKSHGHF